MPKFSVYDPVILHETEITSRPDPAAVEVRPSPRGESYECVVDRYWRVARVGDDGTLELLSAEGEVRRVAPDDPRLERPSWIKRLFRQNRFPQMH